MAREIEIARMITTNRAVFPHECIAERTVFQPWEPSGVYKGITSFEEMVGRIRRVEQSPAQRVWASWWR